MAEETIKSRRAARNDMLQELMMSKVTVLRCSGIDSKQTLKAGLADKEQRT